MQIVRCIAMASTIAFITGCSLFVPKETRFLMSARHQATQEQVKEKMGKPITSQVTPAGDTMWVYHVREIQPGNYMTAPGEWCDEYALMFDRQGVLQDWVHRSYFHGGELMPTYCVPDGLSPKP